MTDEPDEATPRALILDYALEAAPETVWRAVSQAAYRACWLPKADLVDETPIAETPGEAVSYRLRDDAPPHLESVVTFRIAADEAGGTRLTIIHELDDPRLKGETMAAANSNRSPVMRAA